jgi:hypothetical protein
MAQPIPQAWSHLVALNVEFNVLICANIKCRYTLQPKAISRHLHDKHKTPRALQKQVEQYVKAFPFTYDHTSVQLPINGSAPQPIIPIVDGFVCRDCPAKSVSQDGIRKHGNRVHNKKKVPNEEMF